MTKSCRFFQAMWLVMFLLVSAATAATPWTTSGNKRMFLQTTRMISREQLQQQPPLETPRRKSHKKTNRNTLQATQAMPMLVDEKSTNQTTVRINQVRRQSRRGLVEMEDYFTDLDIESLEEGFAVGAAFILLLICICLLCCCCSMCCGGGRRGGGGCSLMDILAAFCCYEMFCDDSPGCFIPMDGEMC